MKAAKGRTPCAASQSAGSRDAARPRTREARLRTRTPGRIRRRSFSAIRPMFAARAAGRQPMKSSRAFECHPAARKPIPPRRPCRSETIQYRSRAPGDRGDPCGCSRAIIARQARTSAASDATSSRTSPRSSSAASIRGSGTGPAGQACGAAGAARASGSSTPRSAARSGSARRAEPRQSFPFALRQSATSQRPRAREPREQPSSAAALRSHAPMPAPNRR